jgi:dihydroorotase/N-acyl-D-amino-acid deacylase
MFARMKLFLPLGAALLALAACTHPSAIGTTDAGNTRSYDVVIANGKIVDGTGNAWYYGDVGIVGDRIARITPAGMLAGAPARCRIDARGLVVAPGVIDIQAHSEEQLLMGDSRGVGMITQGVTTMIRGEGETPGQVSAAMLADYLKSDDTTFAPLLRTFVGPQGFGEWL